MQGTFKKFLMEETKPEELFKIVGEFFFDGYNMFLELWVLRKPKVTILENIQNNFRTMVTTHLVPFEFKYT